MRSISRLAAFVAGIIATILGLTAVIGAVVLIAKMSDLGIELDSELIKPIVICVLFLFCGGSLLGGKGGLLSMALMLVVAIIEGFVWEGSVFYFAEFALALIFEDIELLFKFADVYSTLIYVILGATAVATVCHIVSFGTDKK